MYCIFKYQKRLMKKVGFSILALLVFFYTSAQQSVIQLYNGAAPGSESWTWSEAENDNNGWQTKVVYNVSKPTLTVFAPEPGKGNGTAVVIAPGGAFHALSINSEGYDVAKWLVQKGVTCFVLKYRLARSLTSDPVAEVNAKWGKPEFDEAIKNTIPFVIADGKAAIAWVRSHAAEYQIEPNRVGIMGFSAGGTVAASALFNYTPENKPDFAAPIYPFFPTEMIGTIASDAPPLFIVCASNDGLALAPHSVDLYNKWLTAKRDAELHMYARGDHGFGMRVQNLPTDKWIERFGEWLDVQGLMTKRVPNPAWDVYQRAYFKFEEGKILPYRILYPENYDKAKKYPIVLVLHGGGERGSDNEKQLMHGAKLFSSPETRKNFPAIVVFPQCSADAYWANTKIDRSKQPLKIEFNYTDAAQWPLAASVALVNKLIETEGGDKSRVYVTGLSMGGMGTFEAVFRNPDLFAAALPICGGGEVNLYDKRVTKTPFWVFHGAVDAVVDVKLSQEMVAKLKSLKAEVKYSEYPGVNHNSWDNAFAESEYLKWMFSKKRK
jgi:predicted peptidase